MLILLSFNMMRMSLEVDETLFKPSKAKPPLIAPSPMTATTLRFFFKALAATAMPMAAEMELDAWPQVKVSYSLSAGEGKGRKPCNLRLVLNVFLRPVRIL